MTDDASEQKNITIFSLVDSITCGDLLCGETLTSAHIWREHPRATALDCAVHSVHPLQMLYYLRY